MSSARELQAELDRVVLSYERYQRLPRYCWPMSEHNYEQRIAALKKRIAGKRRQK